LATSAVIAQGIALLVTPVLSRIYDPSAFGYLTLVVSVTSMIVPAVALRLESAVLLAKHPRSATALLAAGALVTIVMSLLAVLVIEILFAMGQLKEMARFPGFSWWAGGISFFSGVFVLLGQFALREHHYRRLAWRNVTQAASTAVAQLLGGVAGLAGIGLVGGYAIGRVAGVAPLAGAIRGELARFRWADVWALLREYRAFPLWFAPAAVLNAASLSLPVICAGLWFDVSSAGQWGMAERVLAVPLVIIAASVAQIVESRLAGMLRNREGGAVAYFWKASGVLLAVGLLVAAAVVLLAPPIVSLVLGTQWGEAARIMQLLTPMLVARLVASPISKSLVVAQWARTNFALDFGRFIVVAGVLLGVHAGGATLEVLVVWTSWAFAVIYLATWIVAYHAANAIDKRSNRVSDTTTNADRDR